MSFVTVLFYNHVICDCLSLRLPTKAYQRCLGKNVFPFLTMRQLNAQGREPHVGALPYHHPQHILLIIEPVASLACLSAQKNTTTQLASMANTSLIHATRKPNDADARYLLDKLDELNTVLSYSSSLSTPTHSQ